MSSWWGKFGDTETAQIAVQASLTGHLVLSTLHTNSASGAVTRLRDMGVESFLLFIFTGRDYRATSGSSSVSAMPTIHARIAPASADV